MPGKPLDPANLQKDLGYTLNSITVTELLFAIHPPQVDRHVLEAGCGSGKLGLSYALHGAKVRLIDIDRGVTDYATQLYLLLEKTTQQRLQVGIIQGNIFKLERLFGAEFDLFFSEGTTHHWSRKDWRRQASINQMVKVCRHGGTVVVIGSNAMCPEMMDYAQRVDHTYMGMPPKQEPLDPSELEGRLVKAGLSPASITVAPVYSNDFATSTLLAGWGVKK